ncbi:formylmethanofuran dehydrogenase, subunit B [Desulfacinum hydrothermale DSM 13146]|uniref:Formylmethanofuran dehydrogenase, subunit B n=1 Tax=Desulfacinum hydrothermale DSM 13146 TaxID=1121390 RepID=A0A1W1X974_9BACT|nr:hypothetical protein [Desulfacinum hydrothermale]SMC20555.1 formylmethanofuran dehydrogenase, subunit B [Desulfacinum hydrothermale DSM 13146]
MGEQRLTSQVCCGCACLCDDIDLVVRDGQVVEAANVCQWGLARFTGDKKYGAGLPRKRCRGPRVRTGATSWSPTHLEGALDAATEILAKASRVVVYGLCQLSQQAISALLDLRRGRPTLWIPSEGPLWETALHIYGQHPVPMTTLEEVRNQADFVLFWGANPLRSCPRLPARYALFPRGRFTERGQEDRRAFTVDIQHTEMERITPLLVVRPEEEPELVAGLRAAWEGRSDPRPSGVSPKEVKKVLQALEQSSYRVFFAGRGTTHNEAGGALLEELCSWVEELNRQAPTFFMPLASDFNTLGFIRQFVTCGGLSRPEWSLEGDVRRWEPRPGDVLLSVSGDCFWFLTEQQKDSIGRLSIPTVAVSTYETQTTAEAQVVMDVGLLGIDTSGDAVRMDGVGVCVEHIRTADQPSDVEIFQQWLRLGP